jgi:ubiquinone biosynthesis accessory factor UbiJ
VNRALRLDPETSRYLDELQGKLILLELAANDGAPVRLYIRPSARGVHLTLGDERLPDVTISGTPSVFLHQFVRGPTVSDALTICGDVELGQRFQRLLRHFKPDWEEALAQFIGDIPAHQAARFARACLHWGATTARTLGLDAAEYFTEEAFVLAKRERVASFLHEVDRLRADVDRLEKRIAQLARTR